MEVRSIITANWLSHKPRPEAKRLTIFLGALLYAFSFSYFYDFFHASDWMTASPELVFVHHEYWRPWTTLFAHADFGHLLSNSLLFFLFAYFLTGYFSLWFFPVAGIFSGGVVNLLVLKTLPPHATLLGISGVVYWMGAAWMTLFLLIDHRRRFAERFGNVLFLTFMLFVPDKFEPQISYLSHFLGFVLGILSGGLYYLVQRRKFLAAELRTDIYEETVDFEANSSNANG